MKRKYIPMRSSSSLLISPSFSHLKFRFQIYFLGMIIKQQSNNVNKLVHSIYIYIYQRDVN